MSTTISIPTPLDETSATAAQQLGLSLNDFVAAALTAYLAKYQHRPVTEQLNQVYQTQTGAVDPVWLTLQRLSLPEEQWE